MGALGYTKPDKMFQQQQQQQQQQQHGGLMMKNKKKPAMALNKRGSVVYASD